MAVMSSPATAAVVLAAALVHQAHSFIIPPPRIASVTTPLTNNAKAAASTAVPTSSCRPKGSTSTSIFMSETATTTALSLTLEKPLGLILEESEDGVGGVIVAAVNEGGSAYESPSKDALMQSKISSIMGVDVGASSFDDVMDAIINAPNPIEIEFAVAAPAFAGSETEEVAEEEATSAYEVGTPVTITVEQPPETNKPPIALEARVGDNLRKTILANGDVELYRGLKKKLGNCGGGGQCGFCAVELIDEEGVWGERSEYEATRIGKNGSEKCRLACMNNIVGPATVKTL